MFCMIITIIIIMTIISYFKVLNLPFKIPLSVSTLWRKNDFFCFGFRSRCTVKVNNAGDRACTVFTAMHHSHNSF